MSFSDLIHSRLVTYCVEQSKAYEYRMTDLWMDALKSQDLLNGHNRAFVRQSARTPSQPIIRPFNVNSL